MSLLMRTWVSEATRTSVNPKSKATVYSWQANYPRSNDKITNFKGFLEIGADKSIRAYIDNGNKKLDPKHDFLLTSWKAKDAPKNLGSSKKIAMNNYYIAGHPPLGGVVVEYDQLTITSGNYSTSSAQFPHAGWVKALGFDPTNINQSLP
jgi:hypothetical protein